MKSARITNPKTHGVRLEEGAIRPAMAPAISEVINAIVRRAHCMPSVKVMVGSAAAYPSTVTRNSRLITVTTTTHETRPAIKARMERLFIEVSVLVYLV